VSGPAESPGLRLEVSSIGRQPSANGVGPAGLGPRHDAGTQLRRQEADGFNGMQAAFLRALEAGPDLCRQANYAIAGRPTRLRIVGRSLAKHVQRPFAHLLSAPWNSMDLRLRIDVWDGEESGLQPPLDSRTGRLARRWTVDEEFLSASADGRFIRYERQNALTWFDRKAGHLLEWWSSAAACTVLESNKPLRMLLPLWCEQQGIQLVHAGLVSRMGRGVLVVGPGGAGKSTTALACLCSGFDFLSDDCAGLEELPDGAFVGHSLYSAARLEWEHLTRFPLLREHALASDDHRSAKSLLQVAECFSDRVAPTTTIRAVALPRVVAAARSRIRPASKGQAMLRLAPSTLRTPLHAGSTGFEQLARLIDQVPSYWLELGRDLSSIPTCVERILDAARE
jgi:hypothetical protein